MNTQQMKELLDTNEQFREFLYVRGFCITDQELELSQYPFYGIWKRYSMGQFYVYVHPKKNVYFYSCAKRIYFLIGHAYDPFSNLIDESQILERASRSNDVWSATNDLTGVFCFGYTEGLDLAFTSDAAGQQLLFYGEIDGNVYLTSHSHLVADLCHLTIDPYVKELIQYRLYHLFGNVLPGDLSPYKELKRAQCNFYTVMHRNVATKIYRFWPINKIEECRNYVDTISEIASILHGNMELISKKWPNREAAISVTGGMDSKTTMACTNGLYDRFAYFSYDSLPDEKVDADAARRICTKLGLEHLLYEVPEDEESYPQFDQWREIFRFNNGDIGYSHDSDVRKRLYLARQHDFDIEVKSWVDEIGRARYHKRFAKRQFPPVPTPRYLTSLYKAFFHNRALVRKTDEVFSDYLSKYYSDNVFSLIPWWDLIYWEFEWNAAEGAFLTGEQVFSYDITIPFNNRKLLELMLSVPLNKRINDQIQKDVIALMNIEIEKTGINVQDVSHTRKRALMERAYLEIHTHIPF